MIYSDIIKDEANNPKPNIECFFKVLKGEKRPKKLYLAEVFADNEIMKRFTENIFDEP